MLPPGLFMVKNTGGGGENDEAELTRREELDYPLLQIAELDIVTGADDAGLVDLGCVRRNMEENGKRSNIRGH